MDRDLAWLWFVPAAFIALYSFGTFLNGSAFLLHIGTEREVHIERVENTETIISDGQGGATDANIRTGIGSRCIAPARRSPRCYSA